MADTIRKVDYFKLMVPDKIGEGARVLQALRDNGVNLLAYSGFPSGRGAQLDFIPEDSTAFKTVAKQAGFKISPNKTVFLIQGDDRPGAVADIYAKLANAKINVRAMDAVSTGEGRYGAILWVKPRDVAKTAKALGIA